MTQLPLKKYSPLKLANFREISLLSFKLVLQKKGFEEWKAKEVTKNQFKLEEWKLEEEKNIKDTLRKDFNEWKLEESKRMRVGSV